MPHFKYTQQQLNYLAERDPILGAYMAEVGKIKREVWGDIFTALIRSIVGQQISTKAHATIEARISEKLGDLTPESVDSLSVEDWQAFGMTFRKAGYIKGVAQEVLSGSLDLEGLKSMSDDELIKRLIKLNGIGVWTAEMLMIFAMNRLDVISFGDLAILRGMQKLYRHRKITRNIFVRHRQCYSPYSSVASLYLWHAAADVDLGK